MEFPNIGARCSIKDCKQLNFLPFECNHCHDLFCKEHFHVSSHKCLSFKDKITYTKIKASNYICSEEFCKEISPIEMQCIKCKKHFCLQHRYHGCLEYTNEEKTTKLKKWQIPKKQFAEAKAIVDEEISNTLKKSKNTAMANKVRLMRLKGSAVGVKNIPMNERCYFLVYLPTTISNKHIGPSKSIYVNINWTIGKAIDSIADILKISNNNNLAKACKLQLFHYATGALICNEMNMLLTKLFENSELVDGQSIILEYSNSTFVDYTLYK
ncbi:AN1-type zinc finger protein 1 [Apis mellifera]|uniref:AN1-type zinc finger protein 1 n=1 Tax=Apis mellifera TaxID=7460 RepID=A0A7M7GV13_APIME|nr:AN1-type zinc finger protein 1 [Apis mellifera]XP_016772130.1 AN1-type zinc finger protein 1 [Apis mellifera]|eukprot:XP_006563431.1 AN1-type zinc finger protein 1 [Apis mellifera]